MYLHSKPSKMPISDFQSQFFMSKIIQIFLNSFFFHWILLTCFYHVHFPIAWFRSCWKILKCYLIHIVNAYCSLQGHAGLTKVGCLAICHFHLVMYILRHYFSFFMSSIFLAAYLHSAQLLRGRNNYHAIST